MRLSMGVIMVFVGCATTPKVSVPEPPKDSVPATTVAPPASDQDPITTQFKELRQRFLQAKEPAATAGNRRFVRVGYVLKDDGSTAKELVVLEFRLTNNFHKKVYFPNRVCAIGVTPDNPTEAKQLKSAIDALEAGEIPRGNPGYQFAATYRFKGHGQCFKNGSNSKRFVWEVRSTKDEVLFHAVGWNDSGKIMFTAPQSSQL